MGSREEQKAKSRKEQLDMYNDILREFKEEDEEDNEVMPASQIAHNFIVKLNVNKNKIKKKQEALRQAKREALRQAKQVRDRKKNLGGKGKKKKSKKSRKSRKSRRSKKTKKSRKTRRRRRRRKR